MRLLVVLTLLAGMLGCASTPEPVAEVASPVSPVGVPCAYHAVFPDVNRIEVMMLQLCIYDGDTDACDLLGVTR